MTAAVHQQQLRAAAALPPSPTSSWWDYFELHRDLPMPPQARSWTCSACSIDWVGLATGLDPDSTREAVVGELGYPSCIDEHQGLKDSSCAVRVMSAWGVEVRQEWVGWNRALEVCGQTTGILNSTIWQHFVAVRGLGSDRDSLWVANSAVGWMGIGESISAAQFAAWAGSWQVIYLVRGNL